jgi:hypothetical protein
MTDIPAPNRWRRLAVCAAALGLLLAAAACGSPAAEDDPPTAGTGTTGAADAADTEPVDVCALLTADEVDPVIGTNDGGRRSGGDDGGSCVWENPETYHSVTVTIGDTGTAASGELPAESDYGTTEPGPDGIRFAPGNIAEFVADNRSCELQVVTSVTDETDRPTTVRLIGLVRQRL